MPDEGVGTLPRRGEGRLEGGRPVSVFRNTRTGGTTRLSENNDFRQVLLSRNRELAAGCAAIAYPLQWKRLASEEARPGF